MFNGLTGILYKEWIQVMRDPATMVIVFIMPLVQLVIYGYAIDTEVKDVPTVILDMDKTAASRDFVNRLEATGLNQVVDYVDSLDHLNAAIVSGSADVGVYLPDGLERKLSNGRQASIQVLIDGSNNTVAGQTLGTVQNLGFAISAEMNNVVAKALPLEVRPRLLFNPSLRSANFFVPGMVCILLFLVTMMLTSFAIVREAEMGTLEQLMVSPIGKGALMLGKILPYLVLGMMQMLFVLTFALLIFKIVFSGSLLLLIALAFVFVFSSLGLGLLISTVAKTQLQAMMMSFMIMLPSVLLSGFIFPRESMPLVIYWLSALLPVTYFIEIVRGIMLRGAGFEALWDETLILAVIGFVVLGIAITRFRKSVSSTA